MEKFKFCVILVFEFLLGFAVVKLGAGILGFLAAGFIYVFLWILPCCRRRECLWTFVLAIPALLPANINFYYKMRYLNLIQQYPRIVCILEGMGEVTALFCAEITLLMLVSKMIWKNQYPFGK